MFCSPIETDVESHNNTTISRHQTLQTVVVFKFCKNDRRESAISKMGPIQFIVIRN